MFSLTTHKKIQNKHGVVIVPTGARKGFFWLRAGPLTKPTCILKCARAYSRMQPYSGRHGFQWCLGGSAARKDEECVPIGHSPSSPRRAKYDCTRPYRDDLQSVIFCRLKCALSWDVGWVWRRPCRQKSANRGGSGVCLLYVITPKLSLKRTKLEEWRDSILILDIAESANNWERWLTWVWLSNFYPTLVWIDFN